MSKALYCLGSSFPVTIGVDIVLFAVQDGFILKHSVKEAYRDVLADNTTQAIECFTHLYWLGGEDMDASYNFGEVLMRALQSSTNIEARYFLDYKYQNPIIENFDFSGDETGFILDVSKLDEGILTDGRTVVRYIGGVYRTSQSLLLTFYQNTINANMNIIEAQLDVSKNGNPN